MFCQQCESGYVLNQNFQCVISCSTGYINLNNAGYCIKCDDSCVNCVGIVANCTTCSSNYSMLSSNTTLNGSTVIQNSCLILCPYPLINYLGKCI